MALIDLDRCLGPTEFLCAADSTSVIEVELPPIPILLRRIVFLHPTGIDAPLDAVVRRVLRQQRLLPGTAADLTMRSMRIGATELIAQLSDDDPAEIVVETGIPIEAFLGVGVAEGLLCGGYVTAPSQRLGFSFCSRSTTRGARIRLAVLVATIAPSPSACAAR